MGKAAKKINPSKIRHPDSRKAQQFIRQKKKEATRDKKKLASFIRLNSFGEKMLWFRDNLEPGAEKYTPAMVAALIHKYLVRFNDELSIINSKKPYEIVKYASRKDCIKHTLENETREYNSCGLEIPDILNEKCLTELLNWNGELRYLQNLTFVRYSKKQIETNVDASS